MKTRWQTLFQKLTAAWRDRLELALAIMALRHQKVMSALQRWRSSWTMRVGQRSSRRDVVLWTQLSDIASVPPGWAPDIIDRVSVPTRSPPDSQSPYHDAPTPANVPINVPIAAGTADVYLVSAPLERWGVHLLLHRQGNPLTVGQVRGSSQQVAA